MVDDKFAARLLGKMGHVARLYGDANLLLKHERIASAAILAALAYEEVGKIIEFVWDAWEVSPVRIKGKSGTAHDRKQRAVACLLLAHDLYPKAKDLIERGAKTEADILALTEALQDTPLQKSIFWVIQGGLEKLKRLAMYWDEDNLVAGIGAEDIERSQVVQLLEVLDPALDALRDERMIRSSSKLWEVTVAMEVPKVR